MDGTVYKAKPKERNHQYAPSNPQNPVPSRVMRNTQNRKRVSLPPSIREENEEDEEDIPLAILAYRKGFIMPLKHKNYSDPSFRMSQNNQFYQLYNSSSSSVSLNELATKKRQYVPGTEPKFYRQYFPSKLQ